MFFYVTLLAQSRELRVFLGANSEPFLVIIHKMFFSRVVRLLNVFTMECPSNSIPLDRPECLKCFDCKYRRETAVLKSLSLNLLID